MSTASPHGNADEPRLTIEQGQFFAYAIPPGWRVVEDGQFAVVLVAGDNSATTIMAGNSGLPANYSAGQYLYDRLTAAGYGELQFSQPRRGTPIEGFQTAIVYDYSYVLNGIPCRGQATCSVSQSYDTSTMVVTCAASVSSQWNSYAGWLPQVACQVAAIDGAAFGMRGLMRQNLSNSMAYRDAAQQYRQWSQQNWKGVVDQRTDSTDRRNFHSRENLGGVQTYVNPYDSRTHELSTEYTYYWVDRQGNTWGTNDANVNPNAGSTQEWKPMRRYQP